jgi:hypothetical protein
MVELATYPLPLIFVGSIVLILAAGELGHWLGLRAGDHGSQNITTLEAAMLGLLALMISFTFAMALTRFDTRREAVLNEANAIGTTALRARLLPSPHNTESLALLREYAKVRLDITQRVPSPLELETAIARSVVVQEALWQQAKAVAVKNAAMVPTGLFIQSLNEMIDNHEKRFTAACYPLPKFPLLSLYATAAVAIAFAGYAGAMEARRWRPGVYVTAMLIAAMILLIQDLDRPASGFVTVSQQPMIDVAASLAGYSD